MTHGKNDWTISIVVRSGFCENSYASEGGTVRKTPLFWRRLILRMTRRSCGSESCTMRVAGETYREVDDEPNVCRRRHHLGKSHPYDAAPDTLSRKHCGWRSATYSWRRRRRRSPGVVGWALRPIITRHRTPVLRWDLKQKSLLYCPRDVCSNKEKVSLDFCFTQPEFK